jgi:hypothetical protein
MKRVLAVAAGLAVGVLVVGAVSPMLMMALPPQLRGPAFLWTTVALVVPLSGWIGWSLAGRS